MSHIIRDINEELDCDDAFTKEIDHRIGCYDDDVNFLRYRDKIKGIEIYIVFNFEEEVYMAFFRRSDSTFLPKETNLSAKTWEILIQYIKIEMRSAEFAQFLGVTAKKEMLQKIESKREKIFIQTP